MTLTPNPYLDLITSEHNQLPKYMAMVEATTRSFYQLRSYFTQFLTMFDIDYAVGEQLDMIGQWVGIGRNLPNALPDGTTALGDDDYRFLLYGTIARDNWDGTVPGLYAIWDTVFPASGGSIFVQDNQDMSQFVVLVNQSYSSVVQAMIQSGYFDIHSAGVQSLGFYTPFDSTHPIFALDVETAALKGLDEGYFVVPY